MASFSKITTLLQSFADSVVPVFRVTGELLLRGHVPPPHRPVVRVAHHGLTVARELDLSHRVLVAAAKVSQRSLLEEL